MPHAKEPWFAFDHEGHPYIAVHPQGHVIIAEMHGISSFNPPERFGNHNENRMRILMCVNALAGMNPGSLQDVIVALKSAAEQLDRAADSLTDCGGEAMADDCADEAQKVRQAIINLTGKNG